MKHNAESTTTNQKKKVHRKKKRKFFGSKWAIVYYNVAFLHAENFWTSTASSKLRMHNHFSVQTFTMLVEIGRKKNRAEQRKREEKKEH